MQSSPVNGMKERNEKAGMKHFTSHIIEIEASFVVFLKGGGGRGGRGGRRKKKKKRRNVCSTS